LPVRHADDTVDPVTVRAAIAFALVAVSLSACGSDAKEKRATSQVCDARADISKQVDALKGLTISTATTSQIQASLKAIGDDLTKIKNARKNLSDERRSQVDDANKAFESQVRNAFSDLGTTTSASDAKTKLTQAFQSLADSYQNTFAKIDCG
jgi:hypothetical protein